MPGKEDHVDSVVKKIEENMGGEVMSDSKGADEFDTVPDAKSILGDGKLHFHEQLPKVEFDTLIGQEMLIKQIQMVSGWDGIFGTSDFALILLQNRQGQMATTLGGGKAIVNQCRKLLNLRRFPVRVTLGKRQGQGGEYYIFD